MAQQFGAYGSVTWLDRLKTMAVLSILPLVAGSRLLLSFFSNTTNDRHKSWKRVLADASFRHMSSRMSVAQMQYVMGTTLDVYTKWAKQNGVECVVDELGNNARLLWLTPKAAEHHVLYIHGGVYCLPVQEQGLTFWKKTINSVSSATGKPIGLAALNYSLIPTAHFPTQLSQVVSAVNHLIDSGIAPQHIHIAGESAGGALVLQLLSHILHPSALADEGFNVPKVNLPPNSRLGSFCIMSPWVSLTGSTGSFLTNSDADVLPASSWAYLGEQPLSSLEGLGTKSREVARTFLEPLKAPDGWFSATSTVVKRVFVSAGEKECLCDDVVAVAFKLKQEPGSDDADFLNMVIDKKGVHNEQFLDIMAGESRQGELAQAITNWLQGNFS